MRHSLPETSPVLSIEPVTEAMRRSHNLAPEARLVLVEVHEGRSFVVSADTDCPFGIEAAARAWAEATGAAYGGPR